MADSYLKIARTIILASRQPLTAREMLNIAIQHSEIPSHLHGKTPHKTLQARLSEDIRINKHNSAFFRTGAGEFFLRELREESDVPDEYKSEYLAPERKKELSKEPVLAFSRQSLISYFGKNKFIPAAHFSKFLANSEDTYLEPNAMTGSTDYLPVVSFVMAHRADSVLSFILGKYRSSEDLLKRRRSIGFGGFVTEQNLDLTYDSFFGVVESGLIEFSAGTGLPRDLAERARYNGELKPRFCTLDKTPIGEDALFVVIDYQCPPEFDPRKPNLSFTGLEWISLEKFPNDITGYDSLSRHLISNRLIEFDLSSEKYYGRQS